MAPVGDTALSRNLLCEVRHGRRTVSSARTSSLERCLAPGTSWQELLLVEHACGGPAWAAICRAKRFGPTLSSLLKRISIRKLSTDPVDKSVQGTAAKRQRCQRSKALHQDGQFLAMQQTHPSVRSIGQNPEVMLDPSAIQPPSPSGTGWAFGAVYAAERGGARGAHVRGQHRDPRGGWIGGRSCGNLG